MRNVGIKDGRYVEVIDHGPAQTFVGLEIVIDDSIPDDEMHFKDKRGNLVGKITGLST